MKIGFKNFKKFQDFPMIELSPITFLVGPNNSGKSSFIKALTLLMTNLRKFGTYESKSAPYQKIISLAHPFLTEFSFVEDGLTHYRWGDFLSCRNVTSQDKTLTLSLESGDVNIDIELIASYEDIANDPNLNLKPIIKVVRISENNTKVQYQKIEKGYEFSMTENKNHLRSWLEEQIKTKKEIISTLNESALPPVIYSGHEERRKDDVIEELKQEIDLYEVAVANIASYPNELLEFHEITEAFDDDTNSLIVKYFKDRLRQLLGADSKKNLIDNLPDLNYIEAHNASHRISLDADDKNNYLAQTVKEFDSEISITEDAEIYKFVCEWLSQFKIAKMFEISRDYDGEIYKVDIIQDLEKSVFDKIYRQPLGRMGTGSIQIFILLLKIAMAIKKSRFTQRSQLVLVEEPEQNLHPGLQSKLAKLFLQVNDMTKGKVQFVVETHSEYLIRCTQIMVARAGYKSEEELASKNPFKVYYFPEEGLPYDMKYCMDGCFEEDFGSGFFDESIKLAYYLFNNEHSF